MLKRTLIFAVLHVCFAALVLVVMLVTGPTDSAEPEGAITRAASSLLEILLQPGIWAHRTFNSSGNDFIEWVFVGFTSLLWGAMFASLTGRRRPYCTGESLPG